MQLHIGDLRDHGLLLGQVHGLGLGRGVSESSLFDLRSSASSVCWITAIHEQLDLLVGRRRFDLSGLLYFLRLPSMVPALTQELTRSRGKSRMN